MGKSMKNPKRYIISCRVSDNEFALLQEVAEKSGVNISTLMRRRLKLKGKPTPRAAATRC